MAKLGLLSICVEIMLLFVCVGKAWSWTTRDPSQIQVPCFFIFGDSLVDNGNNNDILTLARANYQPYGIDFPQGATGRFSNGQTIVDVLTQLMGISDLIPPFSRARRNTILRGVNFASGAAGIRDETGNNLGDHISMNQQVNNFATIIPAMRRYFRGDTGAVQKAYCTVAGALVKKRRLQEANDCLIAMLSSGVELDLVSYNTMMNLCCKEGKLEAAYELLDEIEKKGLECDKYTHTILIDGLCKAGNIEGAQKHLHYMSSTGFQSNLVAFNSLIDGMCKSGQFDHAMRIFKSMKMKDEFTYSSMVQNLCRERRFRSASKLLLSCLKNGMKILKSAERAVLEGFRNSGLRRDARKLQSKIKIAKVLRY